MAQKYPFIKVNLTQEEKDKIERLAKKQKFYPSDTFTRITKKM